MKLGPGHSGHIYGHWFLARLALQVHFKLNIVATTLMRLLTKCLRTATIPVTLHVFPSGFEALHCEVSLLIRLHLNYRQVRLWF